MNAVDKYLTLLNFAEEVEKLLVKYPIEKVKPSPAIPRLPMVGGSSVGIAVEPSSSKNVDEPSEIYTELPNDYYYVDSDHLLGKVIAYLSRFKTVFFDCEVVFLILNITVKL